MNVTVRSAPLPASSLTVFGPVPSRRLGQSLGIGNVPAKTCSYSCVYCQVGPTPAAEIEPRAFWPADVVVDAVRRRVERLRARDERVDFLTFVPDGEPTLDRNLGDEIDGLRVLGIPIAVISNASLVWRADVRASLGKADWVSLKVDAADEEIWRKVNRPQSSLQMTVVREGMLRFAADFQGELASETMLVRGVNDSDAAIEGTAELVERLRPRIAYLAAPIRPPAEPWVLPSTEEVTNRAFQRFAERLPRVELLTGFEGTGFGATGDVEQDILGITAVHPMREDAAFALLEKNGADRAVLDRLVADGRLRRVVYRDRTFYLRRFA
jgi:wyosine [tRNA(Phe)-imidazoG37] synthetase (radical SAM superfamily)